MCLTQLKRAWDTTTVIIFGRDMLKAGLLFFHLFFYTIFPYEKWKNKKRK
jgi:hypothetical protein